MGRTICTEPQYLHKGDLYLTFSTLDNPIICYQKTPEFENVSAVLLAN